MDMDCASLADCLDPGLPFWQALSDWGLGSFGPGWEAWQQWNALAPGLCLAATAPLGGLLLLWEPWSLRGGRRALAASLALASFAACGAFALLALLVGCEPGIIGLCAVIPGLSGAAWLARAMPGDAMRANLTDGADESGEARPGRRKDPRRRRQGLSGKSEDNHPHRH